MLAIINFICEVAVRSIIVYMSTKGKIRILTGAIINIVVFCLGIYCLIKFIGYCLDGNPDNRFRYYTNISNLTVAFIALPNAILLILSALKREMIYPKFFSVIKFIGLSMTTLTFFTVLFILAPLTSFKEMYENMRFITHLIIPLLVMISFLFFEEKTLFEWKFSLLGLIPPLIYSVVYVTNAIWLKIWPDIYQINKQGIWFVYVIALDVFGFVLSEGLYYLKKMLIKS